MKKSGGIALRVLPAAAVIVCIILSAFSFGLLENEQPKNPLNEQANPSHMLVAGSNQIKVDENLLKEQNQMDIKNSSDSSKQSFDSSLAENSESSAADQVSDESAEYFTVKNAQVEYYGDNKPANDTKNDKSHADSDSNYSENQSSGKKYSDSYAVNDSHSTESVEDFVMIQQQDSEAGEDIYIDSAENTDAEFGIYTDLSNQTVSAENLSFKAYVVNGSEKAYLTFNGRKIIGEDHSIALSFGRNSIRLKAVDGAKIAEFSCVVTYVPETTPETAPIIQSINITDGMNILGEDFTLNITAEDCEGNHLYSNNIQLSLNGVNCNRNWENSNYSSYKLKFSNGLNNVKIRLTDNVGRYAEYSYRINCTAVAEGEHIGEITVSIDADVLGLGYIISPQKVSVSQGENGAEVIDKLLKDNGMEYTFNGSLNNSFYLSKIIKTGIASAVNIPQQLKEYIDGDRSVSWSSNKDPDSLGEYDYTYSSGWMYSVNGLYASSSLSDYKPKNGDVLKLRFSLANGKDIGGEGGNYETIW
ncbi:MAG: DUF4430 domain-containing protein [Oscillospiraceae bacterium]